MLLAYVLYDPMVSYTQGMTDLLAPLLVTLEDEVMSFWCFSKLVEQSVFFKPSSVSISMESQLVCVYVHDTCGFLDEGISFFPGTVKAIDRASSAPIL